jgi:hypothetical protein
MVIKLSLFEQHSHHIITRSRPRRPDDQARNRLSRCGSCIAITLCFVGDPEADSLSRICSAVAVLTMFACASAAPASQSMTFNFNFEGALLGWRQLLHRCP